MVHGQYIIIALQTQDFGKESRFFLKGSRFYLYRYRRKPVYNKLTNETEEQHRFQKKMEDMKMKKKLAVVLAASMAAVSLAACGSGTAESGSTTGADSQTTAGAAAENTTAAASGDASLTVAWWGNQTRNERTQAALD